ncbi:MAG: TIGR01777 family oxidoreductase, partial [Spirochaetes bacterium]|nr:TIGR01777 family oxidoreductase [Spirochaetota bacterium]
GWGSLVDGAEAVVNLAGESIAGESLGAIALRRWTRGVKNRILQSRLDAGRAVTEAISAARVKPRTLLQASAIGYYGSRGDGELTEASGPGDGFTAQVCRAWEASTQAVEGLGVRRAVLRTGVVLAPEGGVLPLMALPFRFFAGGPLGDGRQFLPWIHLADEVAAIRHLLESPDASGPYNLSSPQPVSNDVFSRTLGHALHRPSCLRTPALLLRAALGEKSEIVLASVRVLPRRLLDDGFTFAYPDPQGALGDLLAPRTVR